MTPEDRELKALRERDEMRVDRDALLFELRNVLFVHRTPSALRTRIVKFLEERE